ncbi:MAG TPA: toll/interleukin-1 receptor domain-containing protein [Aggregatilineales bacterium]|nr:toll/interleukin-1 receptor domain-containing protein [Aggregatilineales bacterium]
MIYICYAHQDKTWAQELRRTLQTRALHDAWLDERLVPGPEWWPTILHNIEACECFIYVMTAESVASMYCQAQLSYALDLGKPILPFILKLCAYPPELKEFRMYRASQRGDKADVLMVVEQRLQSMPGAQNTNTDSAPPPAEPIPARLKAQVAETFALAEDAAAARNLTLAERLFRHIVEVDPDGQGRQATLRLAELRSDQDRKREYQQIVQMANNPAQIKDARNAWRAFAQRYPGYDPNGLARLTADTMPLTPPPGDPPR